MKPITREEFRLAVARRDHRVVVRELVLRAILRVASGHRARGTKKLRGRKRKFRGLERAALEGSGKLR